MIEFGRVTVTTSRGGFRPRYLRLVTYQNLTQLQ